MYVCTWYQPADERSARGRTSDDGYMYQLSLVVATATASLITSCIRGEEIYCCRYEYIIFHQTSAVSTTVCMVET